MNTAKPLDLTTLTLDSGGHASFEQGACLLEAASYLAGEPWSDHPKCVSPVLGAYGRRLNDRLSDEDRQKLIPLIPRLIGTADDGQDDARRWMAADWAIRVATPRWLDAAGITDQAARLRGLPEIVDHATASAARGAARSARDEAWLARNAQRTKLSAAITAELKKRGVAADAVAAAVAAADAAAVAAAAAAAVADADAAAVAVAVAVAVADADAAAVAVAVAVADAVAVAAAVAVAVADAAAFRYGSPAYWALREKLYAIYREKLEQGAYAEAREITNREAIELLDRMIDPSR